MADCDCLPKCPFFNDKMANMPALSRIWKRDYCQGDFMSCARHQVKLKLGAEKVPADLFPNMTERAQEIISGS